MQRPEPTMEIVVYHTRHLPARGINGHVTRVRLEIPLFNQGGGSVPVDHFGNLDGDCQRDGVHHAEVHLIPSLRTEEERVESIQLSRQLGGPFQGNIVIPFQRAYLVFFPERIKLHHRHADVGELEIHVTRACVLRIG